VKPLTQHIDSIAFVTLQSKNLARSRTFYIDRLGLPVCDERPGEFFQFEIGRLRVCVDYHEGIGDYEANQIAARVDDLEATIALLEESGFEVRRGKLEASWQWASIKDPDGHELIFLA